MPKTETSCLPKTKSSKDLQNFHSPLEIATFAAQRAKLLFGCYRKGDANDPETYTAAVTAILADYSPEVIQRVTDPRTGIPRHLKFMPNPAEVAEACERAKALIKAEKALAEQGWHWTGEKWERAA